MSYPVPVVSYRGVYGLEFLIYRSVDAKDVLDLHMSDAVYNLADNKLHLGHPKDNAGLRDLINMYAPASNVDPNSACLVCVRKHSVQHVPKTSAFFNSHNLLGLLIKDLHVGDNAASFEVTSYGRNSNITFCLGQNVKSVVATTSHVLSGDFPPDLRDVYSDIAFSVHMFFSSLAAVLLRTASRAVAAVKQHTSLWRLEGRDYRYVFATGYREADNQLNSGVFGPKPESVAPFDPDTHSVEQFQVYTRVSDSSWMHAPRLVELDVVFGTNVPADFPKELLATGVCIDSFFHRSKP